MSSRYSPKFLNMTRKWIQLASKEQGEFGRDRLFSLLEAFDKDFANDILWSYMTGDFTHSDLVLISEQTYWSKKVSAIKEIRGATGLGLLEAKNVSECSDLHNKSVVIECKNTASAELFKRNIGQYGGIVSEVYSPDEGAEFYACPAKKEESYD